jgi:hypothetical protein
LPVDWIILKQNRLHYVRVYDLSRIDYYHATTVSRKSNKDATGAEYDREM